MSTSRARERHGQDVAGDGDGDPSGRTRGDRRNALWKRVRGFGRPTSVRFLVVADMAPELPADLEGFLAAASVDAVVLAGDLLSGDLRGLAKTSLPKLGVYGNHCDGRYLEAMGFTNLHLTSVVVGGLRLTGLEGCVRYKAGTSDILYTQDQYRDMVESLPGADVIVTHCPPRGVNDQQDPAHQGIEALRTWVEQQRPRALIHGHTYPRTPVAAFGSTRIEYVHGTQIVSIDTAA